MSEDLTLTEISTGVIQNINTNFSDVEDAVNEKADLNGNNAQAFNVADATTSTHAVNKGQLDNSITAINNSIALKADKTYVDTNLALKANLSGNSSQAFNVANATISTHAINKGQLDISTTAINTSVALKADKAYVDANLSLKVNSASLDAALAAKADKSYVDSNLALKADKTSIPTLSMANYAQGVSKAFNTVYQAECDGYLYIYARFTGYFSISYNNINWITLTINEFDGQGFRTGGIWPITKGMYYKATSSYTGLALVFYPCVGS